MKAELYQVQYSEFRPDIPMFRAKLYCEYDYQHIATVDLTKCRIRPESPSTFSIMQAYLEKVFKLTNSIEYPWSQNTEVSIAPSAKSVRSTSVGDVVVLYYDGYAIPYLCADNGWWQIPGSDRHATTDVPLWDTFGC